MIKFTFNQHKAKHIHKEYKLTNVNPLSNTQLKREMSCYGTKEFAPKLPICKNCKLYYPCKHKVNKKFRGKK